MPHAFHGSEWAGITMFCSVSSLRGSRRLWRVTTLRCKGRHWYSFVAGGRTRVHFVLKGRRSRHKSRASAAHVVNRKGHERRVCIRRGRGQGGIIYRALQVTTCFSRCLLTSIDSIDGTSVVVFNRARYVIEVVCDSWPSRNNIYFVLPVMYSVAPPPPSNRKSLK